MPGDNGNVKKQKRTKKQHYIAQSLIRIFFESDSVFERNIKSGDVYKRSIKDTMCMSNSYELPFFGDNYLEDLFAGSIDADSSTLVKKIISLLNSEEIELARLSLFKGIRMFLINYYKSITSLIHMSNDNLKKDDSSVVRMIDKIFDTKYIDRLAELLCTKYTLYFVENLKENFLMSDQYVSTCSLRFQSRFVNASNREIGMKDTIIMIPLSKKYYALFINGSPKLFDNLNEQEINILSENQICSINKVILNNSYEKCIASDKADLEKIKKETTSHGDSMACVHFASGKSNSFKLKREVFLEDSEYELYKYYDSATWATEPYRNCGVNEKCPCGSGRKYKKCCKSKVDRCKRVRYTINYNQNDVVIDERLGFEEPIRLPKYKTDEISKLFKK